jgi:methionyl-tRNA formyltransferase
MTRAALRVVFFGTPEFAVPSLGALLDGPDRVVAVVCQPDRPAGRGQRLHAPPVKVLAESRGVPVEQPLKIRTAEFLSFLAAAAPDLGVVAAYGRILSQALLDVPRLGFINVHASLLPRYRGAAPIQWAIVRGERLTGVTIMQMNERMDEGDVLLQRETPIGPEETYGELERRLALLGAEALSAALDGLSSGSLAPRPQDHAAATLAPIIRKEDGEIDWTRPAEEIARRVRGFNPWPSAFTHVPDGKVLKIHRARAAGSGRAGVPGTVVAVGDEVAVATGQGLLLVEELQLEGRRRLGAAEFARGGALGVGMRFGERTSPP